MVHIVRRQKYSQMRTFHCNCIFYCKMNLHLALHGGKGRVLVLSVHRDVKGFNLVQGDVGMYQCLDISCTKCLNTEVEISLSEYFRNVNLGF